MQPIVKVNCDSFKRIANSLERIADSLEELVECKKRNQ